MDVQEFLSTAKEKGLTDQQIGKKLHAAGWSADQTDELLHPENTDLVAPPPPTGAHTSSLHLATYSDDVSAWDTFENVLLFISLYVFSTSLVNVLHALVDSWMPPVSIMTGLTASDGWTHTRLTIFGASLLVSFPFFAFFFSDVTRRTLKNPHIRQLKSRKNLIYITLVIAFLVVMYNIIWLVYNLLSGNVTVNFLINFATTLVIFGVIFLYYILQVRTDKSVSA
jgi:hypothetical protein